jgi:hypothetical protein
MRLSVIVRSALTVLLVAGASIAQGAPQCGAYGCNLRWNDCYGNGGAANRNFACDSNAGNSILTVSFVPAYDVASVSGIVAVVDLAFAAPTLPAWWQFRYTGSCRTTSLSVNGTPLGACANWAQAAPAIGIVYSTNVSGWANRARILLVSAVMAADAQTLLAGQEYFAGNLTINHAKTVGTGACAGCLTPVCMAVQSVLMTSPNPDNDCWVGGPANHVDSNVATWQGGGSPVVGDNIGCPQATPTRSSTWGEVKSLYR